MDANKLKKLREIDYEVRECCGMCVSFRGNKATFWGTCSINSYKHKKHIVEDRQLSISVFGWCEHFSLDTISKSSIDLGGFTEFLKVGER